MMLALGCVQSLLCNTNRCPTGITTQDPALAHGLVVEDESQRVCRFYEETMHTVVDLASSCGYSSADQLERSHICRRVDQREVLRCDQLFPSVVPGSFLGPPYPEKYAELLEIASTRHFSRV